MRTYHGRSAGSAVAAATLAMAVFSAADARAQDRMPPIPLEKMTDAQKKAFADYESARDQLRGPWWPMLRAPQSVTLLRPWSDYLRHGSSLSPRIYEFLILITAREWSSALSFASHGERGLQVGLKPEVVKAVADGRRPPNMAEDEEAAYDFSIELHRNHSVSDVTYARALSTFGEQGIIDIIGVNGHYTLISMVLNTSRTPVPKGATLVIAPYPK